MIYALLNKRGSEFLNEESYPSDENIFDELLSYGDFVGINKRGEYCFYAFSDQHFHEFVSLKVGND